MIERHGTGIRVRARLRAWFWRESIWIAPVVGFGIAIGLAYLVITFL